MKPLIEVSHISKRYQHIQALEDVSFAVNQGELFGIIGPDGSGKSTLFRILTTLLLPDQGQAHLNGLDMIKDFREIRKCIGYILLISGSLRRGKSRFLCYRIPDKYRTELRTDQRYLQSVGTFPQTTCRSFIRRYETEAGSLLCLNSSTYRFISG